MEIPLAIIVLGAVGLYGLVFLLVLGRVAGRENDRFGVLSRMHGQKQDLDETSAPLAPQRSKIFVLGSPEEEEEKNQDKMVS